MDRDGSAETPKARVELIDPGRNWVRVTVLDDETGRPVPCRVHFRSPEGVPYQPYGHHNRANSNLPTDNFDIGGDVRPRPDHLRVHRRHLPGLAAAGRRDRRRGAGLRVRPPEGQGADRARPARADATHQAVVEHERGGLVQRRLARTLPLIPGRSDGGRRGGPERRQPAPVPVGKPLHQHGGLRGGGPTWRGPATPSCTSRRRTGST